MEEVITPEGIEHFILMIRGNRVMIDRDLAVIYGVETKYLNRQVKRNLDRFPIEFMFQLNLKETNELVTNWHRFSSLKHSSYLPYAFTEHGVAMIATVLNS
ncbi:MAG: ORF6N domain-containing protein [Bacteroidetes bacterium]|nr:ORF6N domain-containing protein [Bacteroidota bacterium]